MESVLRIGIHSISININFNQFWLIHRLQTCDPLTIQRVYIFFKVKLKVRFGQEIQSGVLIGVGLTCEMSWNFGTIHVSSEIKLRKHYGPPVKGKVLIFYYFYKKSNIYSHIKNIESHNL